MMIMIDRLNLVFLAAGFLLISCNEKPAEPVVPDGQVLNEIRITAELGAASKAVAENGIYQSFVPSDEISLFVWTGEYASGELSAEQTVVNNVRNCFEGESKWMALSPMAWAEGDPVAHEFVAVYPAVELSMPGKLQGSYSAVEGKVEDVLVARVNDQMPTSEPVKLTFNHAMAFLEVNLKLRSEYDGIDPSSIYVTAKVETDGVVDYVDVYSYATGNEVDYRLAASADGLHHRAVLPAQELHLNMVVHLGDVTLTLQRDGVDLILTSGKITTVDLKVGKDVVELSGITVNDWKTGGPIFGETE